MWCGWQGSSKNKRPGQQSSFTNAIKCELLRFQCRKYHKSVNKANDGLTVFFFIFYQLMKYHISKLKYFIEHIARMTKLSSGKNEYFKHCD